MASAMAASTWFHGSAWPPGNQGIMPLGSCHDAMASTVSVSCWAVRMPGTSGRGIDGLPLDDGVVDRGGVDRGGGAAGGGAAGRGVAVGGRLGLLARLERPRPASDDGLGGVDHEALAQHR